MKIGRGGALLVVTVAALAGCGSQPPAGTTSSVVQSVTTTRPSSEKPKPPLTIVGTVDFYGPNDRSKNMFACAGAGEYSDIATGAAVIVFDDTGEQLAMGELGSGAPNNGFCTFSWSAKVPSGLGKYAYEVTNRGKHVLDEGDAKNGVLVPTLRIG